ncbi:uncharacterized protein EI90DRAFT_2908530, partial [Cantharellus anzutake]|uniref:uncharacterized protein n=1 Tax=Cantharellus anzutake TaxID=1750568 RepID=UPI0019068B9F
FETIVCLMQQMQVQDKEWTEFLCYCRHGMCEAHHLAMLRSLLEPWAGALLVTSHHAVRTQWNELALHGHCEAGGNTLYRFRAKDTIGGKELTLRERWALAQYVLKDKQHSAHLECQGGLQPVVELAVGSKVIITTNIDTDMDIANGARGC